MMVPRSSAPLPRGPAGPRYRRVRLRPALMRTAAGGCIYRSAVEAGCRGAGFVGCVHAAPGEAARSPVHLVPYAQPVLLKFEAVLRATPISSWSAPVAV